MKVSEFVNSGEAGEFIFKEHLDRQEKVSDGWNEPIPENILNAELIHWKAGHEGVITVTYSID